MNPEYREVSKNRFSRRHPNAVKPRTKYHQDRQYFMKKTKRA